MTRFPHVMCATIAPLALLLAGCADTIGRDMAVHPLPLDGRTAQLSAVELAARASAAGATEVITGKTVGGGTTLGGKLAGRQFAIAVPAGWDGSEAMVFAHGYSTPGTPVAVAEDPVGDKSPNDTLRFAYADGLAVGHSAYAKDGLGVETGVLSTKRLRDMLSAMGVKRVFAVGESMGGGIVEALLEKYPGAFAGGLSRCGVVDDWRTLTTQIYDMRAAYNVLTAGTPYALPGEQDIRVSALPVAKGQAEVWGQFIRVGTPILSLFAAAAKDPGGREARIVRQVAAIGGFEPDPGALAFPLITASLGASDFAATAGGQPFGNVGKVYASDTLKDDEAKALNAAIQRVAEDRAAADYLVRWHTATGRISDPLVTMHNAVDSLVPLSQQNGLDAKVKAAGRSRYLVSYTVPAMRMPLPIGGVEAYTHCGFTPEQGKAAWQALHGWVQTGQRPAPDAVK